MHESLWEELVDVFTRRIAGWMLDSDTVSAIFATYHDNYVKELTGFSADDWKACRVKAVDIGSAKSRRPCSAWAGPDGDCTKCGVAAYHHPGAPTPAARGCKKFKNPSLAALGAGDALRCEFCCLPLRDHTSEMRAP